MVNPVFLVSIKFLYFALTCLAIERLTVCVTGAGAGVDSAWEQEKLEARKMLENAQTPTSRVHAVLGSNLSYCH